MTQSNPPNLTPSNQSSTHQPSTTSHPQQPSVAEPILPADQAIHAANKLDSQPQPTSSRSEVELFFTTFLTIFVAELGDKTQVTTLLMSAESQSPWVVFLGAGTALILTTLLGVLIGRWLARRVSIETLETMTGCILLVISVLLLWDVVQL